MNAPEVLLILFFLRLVLPSGLLLLIGEWANRQQRARFYRS